MQSLSLPVAIAVMSLVFGNVLADGQSNVATYYRWTWSGQMNSEDAIRDIINSTRSGDFFYLFMGDTQHWHKCTPENENCQAVYNCDVSNSSCVRAQSNYANSLQKMSLTSLIGSLENAGMAPQGLIINGDLTEFGHYEELSAFRSYWPSTVKGVLIYPGLGNHDYANNINDCFLNHCAQRMVEYFKNYMTNHLRIKIDAKEIGDYLNLKSYGSLAYSWDTCANGSTTNCIHFVQLNNFPTYATKFEHIGGEWHIRPALSWLHKDLRRTSYPVVINFHDFDTAFEVEGKENFKRVLRNCNRIILAIFFAHFHPRIGLHPITPYWCINGRATPLLYTGSVPANNYSLVRYRSSSIESLWTIHIHDKHSATIQKQNLLEKCSTRK